MAGNGGECGLKSSIVEGLVYGAGQEPILRLPFQGWTSSRFGIRCSQPRQAAWAYLLLPVSNLSTTFAPAEVAWRGQKFIDSLG